MFRTRKDQRWHCETGTHTESARRLGPSGVFTASDPQGIFVGLQQARRSPRGPATSSQGDGCSWRTGGLRRTSSTQPASCYLSPKYRLAGVGCNLARSTYETTGVGGSSVNIDMAISRPPVARGVIRGTGYVCLIGAFDGREVNRLLPVPNRAKFGVPTPVGARKTNFMRHSNMKTTTAS